MAGCPWWPLKYSQSSVPRVEHEKEEKTKRSKSAAFALGILVTEKFLPVNPEKFNLAESINYHYLVAYPPTEPLRYQELL